jgi:hypothetical protein
VKQRVIKWRALIKHVTSFTDFRPSHVLVFKEGHTK